MNKSVGRDASGKSAGYGRKRTIDILLGTVIFGITGALIGFYLGRWEISLTGFVLGVALGNFVGRLGARRFFYSVLAGTVLGGLLGWLVGGTEVIAVTSGTGSAIGGFIGINIELLVRARHARSTEIPSSGYKKHD